MTQPLDAESRIFVYIIKENKKVRYAIISDIHSNLEALKTTIDDISKRNIDKIVCLGDIVGYGAMPTECIEYIKKYCDIVIMGNHDHAAVGLTSIEFFNPNAKKAIEWTSKQLNESDKEYLINLPLREVIDDMIFTHSTLCQIEMWGYILDEYEAVNTFREMENLSICFVGHSHVPLAFEYKKDVNFLGFLGSKLRINKDNKYIINVGSVGQPRDGNNNSAYVIYDTDLLEIELKRVEYDFKVTQTRIIETGLPLFLAERIQYGR